MTTENQEIYDDQPDELYEEPMTENYDDIPETEQEEPIQPVRKKRRKRGKGLIIFLVIFALAVGSLTACYFIQRQKPIKTVETFLTYVKNMNFPGMESLLQSNDLTALDDADITNGAYSAFFQSINEKMSFEITHTDFNIQNGTANITAKIRYIDGSEIYKETITEFLRQIVATAFSGTELSEEETQQKLAAILQEKSAAVEDIFTEAEIVYPVIEANGQWRIVALDDSTVKIMSANFKNVQDEINQSLVEMETGAVSSAPTAGEGDSINMDNDKFTLRYTQHKVANDFAGEPCLLVYYDYTNKGTSASSAMVDVSLQAYQNGQACGAAIPESNEAALDQFMSEIEPGQTVNVCQAFDLIDMSDVTLECGEAFSFGGGNTASQILKLQ